MRLSILIFRGLRTPPVAVARRLRSEVVARADQFLAPRRGRRLAGPALLRASQASDFDSFWKRLAERPHLTHTGPIDSGEYRRLCPGDEERIRAAAEGALAHRVKLLGPSLLELGPRIDRSRDYKSGVACLTDYWHRGYLLTGEGRYAEAGA